MQSENRNSFSLWIGIFLPLWCLSLLILFPPQSLDIAISGLFFDGQGWPLKNNFFFNTVLYKSSKIIPVAVALASVYILAKNLIAYRRGLPTDSFRTYRSLYVLIAMLASVSRRSLLAFGTLRNRFLSFCPIFCIKRQVSTIGPKNTGGRSFIRSHLFFDPHRTRRAFSLPHPGHCSH